MKKKDAKELQFVTKKIKNKNEFNDDSKKILSFFIVLAIVVILIGGLYYLNAKFISKDHFQDTTTTTTKEATYNDSLMLVDNIFKEKGEYYVLAYDGKDENTAFVYSSLIASYKSDTIKLYSIDLSLKMNSKYYDTTKEESIKKDNFNFTGATLITIKNSKIIKYTTDRDEIIRTLNQK